MFASHVVQQDRIEPHAPGKFCPVGGIICRQQVSHNHSLQSLGSGHRAKRRVCVYDVPIAAELDDRDALRIPEDGLENMRWFVVPVLLHLTLPSALQLYAQSCPAGVLKAEHRLIQYARAGDVNHLRELLDQRFVAVSTSGITTDKEQLLKRTSEAGTIYKRLDAEDLDIRCYRSTAVVLGTAAVVFASDALASHSGRYRYLRVYVVGDGRWKAVSLQLSRLEPSAPASTR